MTPELPERKGTYILLVKLNGLEQVCIGRLGAVVLTPGFYCYVGSAFGTGGLRARLGHHLSCPARPHWHIDYLLQVGEPVEIWYSTASPKLESRWADMLAHSPRFAIPVPRFGCSDYRRTHASHLFFSKRRPSFTWFERRLALHVSDASPHQVIRIFVQAITERAPLKRCDGRCNPGGQVANRHLGAVLCPARSRMAKPPVAVSTRPGQTQRQHPGSKGDRRVGLHAVSARPT